MRGPVAVLALLVVTLLLPDPGPLIVFSVAAVAILAGALWKLGRAIRDGAGHPGRWP